MDCFVASLLAMTSNVDISPHSRGANRVRAMPKHCPSITAGAGNAGCPMHPQPRARNSKAHERSHYRYAATSRHSLHDGSTAYIRAPRCPGFPVTVAGGSTRQLDPSVARSGPHDFAVRMCVARLATPTRPPHPDPTSVAIARTPPLWDRTSEPVHLICPTTQARAPATK